MMEVMNNDVVSELFKVVLDRKTNPEEGSYTCYLFEKGLDKILKKVGEECSEAIIAAKNLEVNGDSDELKNEICDLLYHVLVLMAQQNVGWDEVAEILEQRRLKIGNLKQIKTVDKNT